MKKLLIVVLVLFVLFWMVQAPTSMATFASDGTTWIWDTATMLFDGAIDFLGALFD